MLELLVMTWMLTAVVAGIILARSRFKKRTSIPLVPLIHSWIYSRMADGDNGGCKCIRKRGMDEKKL